MVSSIVKAFSLFSLAVGVLSSPLSIRNRRDVSARSVDHSLSFNNWGGLSSLNGFDNFFGSNDFFGSNTEQIIVIEQEDVCEVQDIVIIQQQLAIIQEFAKRVITQQICDVETQIIVLEQFRGGLRQFQSDIRRQSGRSIGYDHNISLLIIQLLNQDGSFNSHDFGFQGSDIGRNLVAPGGSNWNDATSPQNINSILGSIDANSTITSNSTSPANNTSS